MQKVVFNGHKRSHALKFQAVTTPDGLILHAYGPVEGRRHDWTLYTRSEIDSQLEAFLRVGEDQFCIYGDSGYNERLHLQIPFQGSQMSPEESSFNKAMSSGRISVEWLFKEIKT